MSGEAVQTLDFLRLAGLLLLAGGIAAALTPAMARLAVVFDVVDRPSERSVAHREAIPLLGGIPVALGFGAALTIALHLDWVRVETPHLIGFGVGALVILLLGIADDRFALGATWKFGGQILAAMIAIASDFRLEYISEPVSKTSFFLPEPLVWLVSLLWIVGITNSLNLIDGLDGLATGVGAIICATLTLILAQSGQVFGVCLGVALLGGLLGFLPFNFPPARIFLGDTGALFIGYTLSLLALEGYRQVTLITFVVPLLALAIPILDTLLSIFRRLRARKPLFSGDRLHMHHRMLDRQGSPRSAVLNFYFMTACFSAIALAFTRIEGLVAAICLAVVALLTLRLLWNYDLFTHVEDADAPAATAGGRSET